MIGDPHPGAVGGDLGAPGWLQVSFRKVEKSPDAVSEQLRTHSHNLPQRFALD